MPLYEYECESCAERVERIQKYSDSPLDTCPKCGGRLKKLLSSPAFQFKGSGWYVTDYARKPEKTEKTDKTDKADKAAGSEGEKPAGESAPAKSGAPASEGKADKPAVKDSSKS